MEILKGYWKVEPEIDIEGKTEKEVEDLIHDKLMDITMNPHDYIEFEKFEDLAD